ncbi:MAG: glycoside hydrolase family 36 protein [Sedimentisphaeraceae bacterium JB056]
MWKIKKNTQNELRVYNTETDVQFCDVRPSIDVNGHELKIVSMKLKDNVLSSNFEDIVSLEQRFIEREDGSLRIETKVANKSSDSISIDNVVPVKSSVIELQAVLDRNLVNSKDMVGVSKLNSEPGKYCSYSVAAFTSNDGDFSVVAGFEYLGDAFYKLNFEMANGIKDISAVCEREGVKLDSGSELDISAMLLYAGDSMSKLMDCYSTEVAKIMGCRDSEPQTGWCSWYYYYDQATEEDIWDNVNAMADSEFAGKVNVIQIDDGWNLPSSDAPRVWGDWFAGGMFPDGMKKLADGIKGKGFVPGLWLAPFSVDTASNLYRTRPDLLVQKDGKPLEFWGVCGLDLSNPEAIEFVKETFKRVFDQWGFEYIKIDFLLHAVLIGDRYDNTRTTASLLRSGLEAIRSVAGKRYILCCGCPLGPAVGICDAMRVGYDVSSRWDLRINTKNWPLGNLNIRAAALQSNWRQWMHRRWWQNDADCIITRDYGSGPEKKMFAKDNPEFKDEPAYGLTDNEASCWSQFVWFTGGMAMHSEKIDELDEQREKLLLSNFPPNSQVVKWVDYYPSEDVFLLKNTSGKKMIGVFNFSEKDVAVELNSSKLGLTGNWSFVERLSGEKFEGNGDIVKFPVLNARSGKVWILQ